MILLRDSFEGFFNGTFKGILKWKVPCFFKEKTVRSIKITVCV